MLSFKSKKIFFKKFNIIAGLGILLAITCISIVLISGLGTLISYINTIAEFTINLFQAFLMGMLLGIAILLFIAVMYINIDFNS